MTLWTSSRPAKLPVSNGLVQRLVDEASASPDFDPKAHVKWSVDMLYAELGRPPFHANAPPGFRQAVALADVVFTALGSLPSGETGASAWSATLAVPPLPAASASSTSPALRTVLTLPEIQQKLPILATAYLKDATPTNRDPAVVVALLRCVFVVMRSAVYPLKDLLAYVDRTCLFRSAQRTAPGTTTLRLRVIALAMHLVVLESEKDREAVVARVRGLLRLGQPAAVATPSAPAQAAKLVPAPSAATPQTSAKSKAIKKQMAAGGSSAAAAKPSVAPSPAAADTTTPPAAGGQIATAAGKHVVSAKLAPECFLCPSQLRLFVAWLRWQPTSGIPPIAEATGACLDALRSALSSRNAFAAAVGSNGGALAATLLGVLGDPYHAQVLKPEMLCGVLCPELLPALKAVVKRDLGALRTARSVFDFAHMVQGRLTAHGGAPSAESRAVAKQRLDDVMLVLSNEVDMRVPQALLSRGKAAWAERVTKSTAGEVLKEIHATSSGGGQGGGKTKKKKGSGSGGGGGTKDDAASSSSKHAALEAAAASDEHPVLAVLLAALGLARLLVSATPARDAVELCFTVASPLLRLVMATAMVQDWRPTSDRTAANVAVSAAVAALTAFSAHAVDKAAVPSVILPTSTADALQDFIVGVVQRAAFRATAAVAVRSKSALPPETPAPRVTSVLSVSSGGVEAAVLESLMADVSNRKWLTAAAAAKIWRECSSLSATVLADAHLWKLAAGSFDAAVAPAWQSFVSTGAVADGHRHAFAELSASAGQKAIICNGLRGSHAGFGRWAWLQSSVVTSWDGATSATIVEALAIGIRHAAEAVVGAKPSSASTAGPTAYLVAALSAVRAILDAAAASGDDGHGSELLVKYLTPSDLLRLCPATAPEEGHGDSAPSSSNNDLASAAASVASGLHEAAERRFEALKEKRDAEAHRRAAALGADLEKRVAHATALAEEMRKSRAKLEKHSRKDAALRATAHERVQARVSRDAAEEASAQARTAALADAWRHEAANAAAAERAETERRHARMQQCHMTAAARKKWLVSLGVPETKANAIAFKFLRHTAMSSQAVLEYLVSGTAEEPADVIERLKKKTVKAEQQSYFTDEVGPSAGDGDDFWASVGAHATVDDDADAAAAAASKAAAASLDHSLHERLSRLLDAFDFTIDEATGGLSVAPLPTSAIVALLPREELKEETGFDGAQDALFMAQQKGLLTVSGGLVSLSRLGCAYHVAFADHARSVAAAAQSRAAALRTLLAAKGLSDPPHDEEGDDADFEASEQPDESGGGGADDGYGSDQDYGTTHVDDAADDGAATIAGNAMAQARDQLRKRIASAKKSAAGANRDRVEESVSELAPYNPWGAGDDDDDDDEAGPMGGAGGTVTFSDDLFA